MLNSHLTMFNGFVGLAGPGVPWWDGRTEAVLGTAEYGRRAQAMRGIAKHERQIDEG